MYDNVLFPLSVDRCVSETAFDTEITELGNGSEIRTANWDDGLITFNAILGVRDLDDLRTLRKFHILRRGRARSFPVRDPIDCQANFDGSVMAIEAVGTGAAGPFQLTKTYSDAANSWIREIKKPEQGTIKIYVAAVLQVEGTAYTINYQTGLITFLTGHFPASSATIEWSGRFYVPVRFTVDKLPIQDIMINMKADADGQYVLPLDATASLPDVLMIEDRDA